MKEYTGLKEKKKELDGWLKQWEKEDFPGRVKTREYYTRIERLEAITARIAVLDKLRKKQARNQKVNVDRATAIHLLKQGAELAVRRTTYRTMYKLKGNRLTPALGRSLITDALEVVRTDQIKNIQIEFYRLRKPLRYKKNSKPDNLKR